MWELKKTWLKIWGTFKVLPLQAKSGTTRLDELTGSMLTSGDIFVLQHVDVVDTQAAVFCLSSCFCPTVTCYKRRYEHLTRLLLHHLRWLLLEPLCRPRGHSLRKASVITCPGVQPTKSPRAGRPSPSCCFLDPPAHSRRSVCGETSKLSVSCGQGCQTGRVLCWTDEAAYRTSCWIKTAALNNQMWSLPFKKNTPFFPPSVSDFVHCVSL